MVSLINKQNTYLNDMLYIIPKYLQNIKINIITLY